MADEGIQLGAAANLAANVTEYSRLMEAGEEASHVHAIAVNVVSLLHDIADINADTETDTPIFGTPG